MRKMKMTREQAIATLSAALVSGAFDLATRDGLVAFIGLAITMGIYEFTPDIVQRLTPGHNPEPVLSVASTLVNKIAPEEEDPTKDQSVGAKLRRLVGLKTPPIAAPRPKKRDGSSYEAQPGHQEDYSAQWQQALQQGQGASLRPPTIQSRRGYFCLSDVLDRGFKPSLDKIYLVTLEDGRDVFVPALDLCHVALAGATRGGKGHLKRSLMAQLCYAGAEVYLLDPHYTSYDRESRDPNQQPCPEDWTPFEAKLQNDPRELVPIKTKFQVIEHYLREAMRMLDARLELFGRSIPVGKPVYLIIDELPLIKDNIAETPTYLKRLLREGAKVGIFLVTAAQDYLVQTLFPGEGGALRDCYRTTLYVGGDPTTAKTLLDMPAKDVPETRLGKGRVMVKCETVRKAAEGRAPYVDNEAIYRLVGPSTFNQAELAGSDLGSNSITPFGGGSRQQVQAPVYSNDTGPAPMGPASRRHAGNSYDAFQRRRAAHGKALYSPSRVATQADQQPPVQSVRPPVTILQPGSGRPEPTLKDAIAVWNEIVAEGKNPGRGEMQKRLNARGFECGENKARSFIEEIRVMVDPDGPNPGD